MTAYLILEDPPGDDAYDAFGRLWWGHPDVSDPETGEFYDACWTLAESPSAIDTYWAPAAALPAMRRLTDDRDEVTDWHLHPSLTVAERNPSLCAR